MKDTVLLRKYQKTIPTYALTEDEKYPIFRNWANLRCYPYPFRKKISRTKTPKDYFVYCLENNYLKVEICPDLGGRILSAVYKPLNKPLFFTNPDIKPSMLALNGAWIVTGVEFNCPYYGHSATGLYPVHHASGGETEGASWVRVGFHDRLYGMRWTATISLAPDSTAIETIYRIYNPNKVERPCYLWINAAITADPSSRIFLPADFVRDQSFQVFQFPVDPEAKRHFDRFADFPVDIDLYGLDAYAEAFGYYDSKAGFGLAHFGPKNHLNGKKFFTWGTGKWSETWAKSLTDTNEAYYEIQAGMLETQTDFRFIAAESTLDLRGKWYPLAGLGPILTAGEHVAASLINNKLRILSCGKFEGAEISVAAMGGSRSHACNLEPGVAVELEGEYTTETLREISVQSRDRKPLLIWKRRTPSTEKPHRAVRYYPNPKTVDDFYHAGLEWELKDDKTAAERCFTSALKLEPNHAQTLVAYARLHYLNGRYLDALELVECCLSTAPRMEKAIQLKHAILHATGKIILASPSMAPEKDALCFNKDIQSYIDGAIDLLEAGQFPKALKTLQDGECQHPALGDSLIEYWYYMAYASVMAGRTDLEKDALNKAAAANPDYAFPYRLYTEKVLKWVLSRSPDAAPAHYLLGNLLMNFDRHEEALIHFEKAGALGMRYAVLERNLGLIKARGNASSDEAERHYRRALELDPESDLVFMELYDLLNKPGPQLNSEKARELLRNAPDRLKSSSAVKQKKAEYLFAEKRYAEAIEVLKDATFQLTEWRQGLLELYRDLHLGWAVDLMKQGEKKDTIKTLYQFPNLPAGLSLKDETPLSDAPAFYLLLLLGETKDWAGRNIAMQVREFPCYFEVLLDVKYYHAFARCLELTGETKRAKALYGEMKAFAERNLVNYPGMSDWWNPLLALAFKGLGDMQEAEKRLSECLTAHPSPFYQIELDELRNLTS